MGPDAGGVDEDLAPSNGTGEAVDNSGASASGVATAGVFLTGLSVLSDVGDNTAGGLLKTLGSDVIDGDGVGVDAGIAAGDGPGAEAVPHPSSPSMTTNVGA